MKIEIDGIAADLSLNDVGKNLMANFPSFGGVMRRYGDEMYFLVNFDFSYASETSDFEVGDVIYWKSEKSWKEAIAFFWGPTPIGEGCTPRAPGPAIKIGTFDYQKIEKKSLVNGSIGRMILG